MAQHSDYQQLCQQALPQWRRGNVLLNPGAGEQELIAWESRYAVNLPEDFRYLYSLANGMKDGATDEFLFSLWSLSQIAPERDGVIVNNDLAPPRIEIAFGDYCINLRRYYLVQHSDGFIVKTDLEKEVVATSFAHFLALYLSRPEDLYL